MIRLYIGVFCLSLLTLGVLTEEDNSFDFHQSDYVLNFERVELARYNKKLVKQFEVRTFKYNRTSPVVNITYKYNIDVGNDVEIVVQTYKFASNEYRLFPLRLEVNFCDAIRKNLIGTGRFLKCGNFTGCPMSKNTGYHYCNWSPDQSHFPPLIPSGQYMLELQGVYHSTELFVLNAYGTISRPITRK